MFTGEDETGRRVPGVNHGIDVVVWIYITSYLWEHVLILMNTGLRTYRQNYWAIYGLVTNLCFLAAFMARILSLIVSTDRGDKYENEASFFPHFMCK